jgi:septum formation protein
MKGPWQWHCQKQTFLVNTTPMKWMDKNKLVLASRSPRRKQLLEQMGFDLEIVPPVVDETTEPGQSPLGFVKALSEKKTVHIMERRKNAWVIGADTIVVTDDRVLGKPENRHQAIHMLGCLSGRTHSVFTGYTVGHFTCGQMVTCAVETQVVFKALTKHEILWYTGTSEPYDKAGGYGVQGSGAFMVKEIHGSYPNVVGLPVCEVIQTLASLGVIQFKEKYHDTD